MVQFDRNIQPWLESINEALKSSQSDIILACSAIKASYRSRLVAYLHRDIHWIHLQCDKITLAERLSHRKGHFFNPNLLSSQLATYEVSLYGLHINAADSHEIILKKINDYIQIPKSSIGLIGLGVMGTSLARNIASKGHTIAIYNRHVSESEEEIAKKAVSSYTELSQAYAFDDLVAFCDRLSSPKNIIIMVNAGKAVDDIIGQLIPLLHPGDCILDGGNSHYHDTERRIKHLNEYNIRFLGCGVSGGEEGALLGPSIMAGGNEEGYDSMAPILTSISARNDQDELCCTYVGQGGSGHFVKMVHNGIEYAEMQLIAEIYSVLRYSCAKSTDEIADILNYWNGGHVSSYLLEIMVDILRYRDHDGQPLIDKIYDSAGSKGTGSWTTAAALDLGEAIPTLTQALYERFISTRVDQRQEMNRLYTHEPKNHSIDINALRDVYYFAKIMNHHQGLALISRASEAYKWDIELASLLQTWSAGCIIRSAFIDACRQNLASHKDILTIPDIVVWINLHRSDIQATISILSTIQAPTPVIQSSLQYFKSITAHRSSAYIIQAQRDYFGAHTYTRIDDANGISHHTIWKNK